MSKTAEILMDPVVELQLTPNEIRFYREEGYLYIPGAISREIAAQVREELIDIMASAGRTYEQLCNNAGASGKLIQSGQYLRDSALDSYINSPNLRSLASQLVEGEASIYMPFSAVKAGGGGGTFHYHQDNQYTFHDGPSVNLWMAVSPMSPENGCLNVVPRSHLNGTISAVQNPDGDGHRTVEVEPTQFLPIRMNPGDIIAFSRLTLHGSGPNFTREPRFAYAVQFHRNDVRARWEDGEFYSLLERPRFSKTPVEKLTVPDANAGDGH